MSLKFKAPGWSSISGTLEDSEGRLPIAWMATCPLAEEDLSIVGKGPLDRHCGLPVRTLERLPRGGILIAATGPRAYTGTSDFPLFRAPLRVANGWRKGRPLAVIRRNLSTIVLDRMVEDELLNIAVWFGAEEPTPETVQHADQVLATFAIDHNGVNDPVLSDVS
jgi:hypothetical protein